MDYTSTALLASIRRRAALPTATAAGCADSDLLALINEELQSFVVPLIMDLREEYFVAQKSTTMTVGTAAYRIPSRAVGAKLRDVEIVNSAGSVSSLDRLSQDELWEYPTTSGTPGGFYIQGNNVVVVPPPNAADSLRQTIYRRPNEVKLTTAVGTITAINTSTKVVTCSDVPVAFTTSLLYDLVSGSSGFESYGIDLAVTARVTGASGTVTFTATLPLDLAIGDHVCIAEQSPVPQIPAEFHPLLSVRVAKKMAQNLGNANRVNILSEEERSMAERIRSTFAPRVDGEPKILVPNSHGLLGGKEASDDWW